MVKCVSNKKIDTTLKKQLLKMYSFAFIILEDWLDLKVLTMHALSLFFSLDKKDCKRAVTIFLLRKARGNFQRSLE